MKKLLALAALLALPLVPQAADPTLLDAVRAGDNGQIRRLLASGASPNTADATGATALMYAAAYGSVADMTALLDAGANINAANTFQSTPLMWAAGETAKVQLLLARGANPDARAVDRTNALLAAVRQGNPETVTLLLKKAADPKATPNDVARLLGTAYLGSTPAVRQVLADNGIEMKQPVPPGAPFLILNLSDAAMVRRLLDLGASPNEEFQLATLTLPALALAAGDGMLDTARLLVERGADPSKSGTHGYTPLMMAAGSPRPGVAMVQLLIDRKADLTARDDAGRSALDWAISAGDAPTIALLKRVGAPSTAPALTNPAPVASPRPAREAVAQAITRLQPIGPTFYEHNKCISCHNQSLPAMAVKVARDRQIPVDQALASHPTQASLDAWRGVREQVMLGNGESALGGFAANLSYGLSGMADEGVPANAVTDAMAYGLALSQRADGSFTVAGPGLFRSPLGSRSEYAATALSIKALNAYAPPGRAADTKARLDRALAFVRSEETTQTQDYVFKLLGLVWSKAPAAERETAARQLLALQRADGGWAQLPGLSPDAFATGQALYALHENGMAVTSDAYRKGADYLRRTQLPDGSWFVRSRAFGFQPYFDTGFPHGKDQFISAAATSFAALALAYTL